jgi:hypothetical protein
MKELQQRIAKKVWQNYDRNKNKAQDNMDTIRQVVREKRAFFSPDVRK